MDDGSNMDDDYAQFMLDTRTSIQSFININIHESTIIYQIYSQHYPHMLTVKPWVRELRTLNPLWKKTSFPETEVQNLPPRRSS